MIITDNIKQLVRNTLSQSADAIASMDEIKEWNSLSDLERNVSTIKQLIETTVDTIEEVEDHLEDVLSDPELRDLVIDSLDALIVLPHYLEWMDHLILRLLVALVLEERYRHV